MRGFLIGYPGDGLTVTGSYAGMRLLSFGMPIASSSERHFLLHDENCDIVRAAAPDALPLTRLCGISGCAVTCGMRQPTNASLAASPMRVVEPTLSSLLTPITSTLTGLFDNLYAIRGLVPIIRLAWDFVVVASLC